MSPVDTFLNTALAQQAPEGFTVKQMGDAEHYLSQAHRVSVILEYHGKNSLNEKYVRSLNRLLITYLREAASALGHRLEPDNVTSMSR